MANRHNREGIYVPHPSRAFRDEEGKSFWVDIEIVDKYRYPSGSQAPYNVTVSASHQPIYTIKGCNSNFSLIDSLFVLELLNLSKLCRQPCWFLVIIKVREG